MFCHNCGNQVADDSIFCDKCGTRLETSVPDSTHKPISVSEAIDKANKEVVWTSPLNANVAGALSLFFGALGVHDFYCGNSGSGFLKLIFTLTGVLSIISVIWNLMDLYSIGEGSYRDSDGLYLEGAGWAKVAVILQLVFSVAFILLVIFVIIPFILHALKF